MKTTSKVFAIFFIALGFMAAAGAFYGATHQWFMAGICAFIAIILLFDAAKKLDASEKVSHR